MGLIVAAGLVGPPAHRKAAEQGVSVMVTMLGPVKLILLYPLIITGHPVMGRWEWESLF